MSEQTVSMKVNIEGKNIVIAYVLWFFLGALGIYRFYLGRTKSAIAQLSLFVVGWVTYVMIVGAVLLAILGIWWLADAYFTYVITNEENKKLGITNSVISLTKTGDTGSDLDQLEKLHSLFEKGVFTKEEYEAKKAAIMGTASNV